MNRCAAALLCFLILPAGGFPASLPAQELTDDFLHATAGASLVLLTGCVVLPCLSGPSGPLAPGAGPGEAWPAAGRLAVGALGLAVAAAAGKEALDALGTGTPQWSDFTATVKAAAIAAAVVAVLAGSSPAARLDAKSVPLVLGTAGVALFIPPADSLLRRLFSGPPPARGSGLSTSR